MPPTPPTRPIVHELEPRWMLHAGVLDTAFGEDGVASLPTGSSSARLSDVATTPDGRIVMTGSTVNGMTSTSPLNVGA